MKAVYWHADASFAWGGKVGDTYKRLAERFVPLCHKHGMQVVHLTAMNHEGWGDEVIRYDLDPKHVMLNREVAFAEFLEAAPDDVYWFTEPDYEIFRMWPALEKDLCMLKREDHVPLTPAWRMATKKALPVFRKACEDYLKMNHSFDWHGDSHVWTDIYHQAKDGEFLGVQFEFRPYGEYIKGKTIYGANHLAQRKFEYLQRKA